MPGSLIQFLVAIIQIYSYVILARIVLSWIPNISRSHPAVEFLHRITDPVLEPVRRMIPPLGALDISPIVVFLGLHLLRIILLGLAR